MPKYRCSICGLVKQMNKLDPDCDFCGDSGLGQMILIRGEEGMGVKRRILGLSQDEIEEEESEW